jgi:hypothetical protein
MSAMPPGAKGALTVTVWLGQDCEAAGAGGKAAPMAVLMLDVMRSSFESWSTRPDRNRLRTAALQRKRDDRTGPLA